MSAPTQVFVAAPCPSGTLIIGSCGEGTPLEVELRPVCAGVPGRWLRAVLPRTPPHTVHLRAGGGAAGSSSPQQDPQMRYMLPSQGVYRLDPRDPPPVTSSSAGVMTQLSPHPLPPCCLVTDLDGTMVGADDGGTAAFRDFWSHEAVPRGCALVYNTGRSMELYQQLLQEKGHHMAVPDVLITGVGTRVHNVVVGGDYVEDLEWTSSLGEGWDLGAAQAGVAAAQAELGPSGRCAYRPPHDQNEHKVTIELHKDEMEVVVACVERSVAAAGATATIITSWHGDMRVLDILPARAGKRIAMEYVQAKRGFADGETIAAGDSGNDVLMLNGTSRGIVVGNAMADLRHWLATALPRMAEEAAGSGAPVRVHAAAAPEAQGVLEGLRAMGFAA